MPFLAYSSSGKAYIRVLHAYTYTLGMITCKCETPEMATLTEMTPFQDELKKRSAKDIASLAATIKEDGLLTPFMLWEHEDKKYILDGHGRREALVQLALNDPAIIEQKFPAVIIQAETREDAIKAVLQISSSYGRINKAGAVKFTAPIVGYKAPYIKRLEPTVKKPRVSDDVVIKIKVRKDKASAICELLRQTEGIEVL